MKTLLALVAGLVMMTGTVSARDHHYYHHGGYRGHYYSGSRGFSLSIGSSGYYPYAYNPYYADPYYYGPSYYGGPYVSYYSSPRYYYRGHSYSHSYSHHHHHR